MVVGIGPARRPAPMGFSSTPEPLATGGRATGISSATSTVGVVGMRSRPNVESGKRTMTPTSN
eukprot:2058740-Lingulodinium_polyedra.AAC.1